MSSGAHSGISTHLFGSGFVRQTPYEREEWMVRTSVYCPCMRAVTLVSLSPEKTHRDGDRVGDVDNCVQSEHMRRFALELANWNARVVEKAAPLWACCVLCCYG
jgi:hypothetical protein